MEGERRGGERRGSGRGKRTLLASPSPVLSLASSQLWSADPSFKGTDRCLSFWFRIPGSLSTFVYLEGWAGEGGLYRVNGSCLAPA